MKYLVVAFIFAVALAGTTECTSAASSSANNRLWEALKEGDEAGLMRLFGYEKKDINGEIVPVWIGFKGKKPNINAKKDGATALLWAVDNDPSMIPVLLKLGADPNEANYDLTETPLTRAVENENYPVASFLVSHGADPNIAPVLAPLFIAVQLDNAKLATFLAPLSYTHILIGAVEYAGAVENVTMLQILIKALEEREAAMKEARETLAI